MKSKCLNRRGAVALLAIALAVGGVGCSGSDGDSGPGSGGTGGAGGAAGTGGSTGNENPCLESGNPACSRATLDSGFGSIQIFFDEQRVEVVADMQLLAASPKQAMGRVSAVVFESTIDVSTTQPGDTFTEVQCATYSIEDFIQAEEGRWFNFVFTSGGNSAPLTVRATSEGGSTYTLEAAWGIYPCPGVSSPACDAAFGSAPGYRLCDANAVTCEFWFQTPGRDGERTCDQVCNGRCVGSYDDDMQMPCTMTMELPCGETLADGVCLCSL